MKNYRLEILTIVAITLFSLVFLYTNSLSHENGFSGTDSIAVEKIAESSPSPEEIHPLIPQWTPPGGEIESTLFGLQAATGGIIIGGVFGYWIGQKKNI